MAQRPQTPARTPKGNPPPAPAGWSRDRWLGLALLGLVLLAFYPALSGGFIWDDDAHLTANPCIVGPLGLTDIWTSAHMRICPLVQTTFWLEYRVWGLHPLPYHLVNLLMHAASAVVLWRVLRMLRVPGAWLGAALWAVHPVQVETVAWITELKNTQSGLFYLLAVLCFCRSRLTGPGPDGRAGWYYGLTLLFAALAMTSKSSTVVLPLVLGLCAWWLERDWSWRRNLPLLAPLLGLSVLSALATIWTQQVEGAFDPDFALGYAQRLAVVGKVVWFYLGKLLWPHPLIFIYPRWRIEAGDFAAYLPTLALVGVLGVVWGRRDGWARPFFFTLAGFVAALLPVLGLIDTYFWRYAFVGDHFQYLASMAPLALIAAGLHTGLGALGHPWRWLRPGISALLLLILGLLTWRQCALYQNDETLWSSTLRLNPASWIAHNNLGIELDLHPGRATEAIAHYEAALRLRPDHARAHSNLARDLARIPGRQDEAVAHYESALRLDPSLGWAHHNLATLLAGRPGRAAEALAQYEEALRLQPDSAETHYNLAIELGKIPGRAAEVIPHFRAALRLMPDFAAAHNNLGLVLAQQPGGAAEAAEHFTAALRLRPDWDEAHNNYAGLLSSLPGRLPEAIAHYEQALRLRPEAPLVHYNLAGAYYRSGRLAEAINQLELVRQLDPGNEDVRHKLDALRRELPH